MSSGELCVRFGRLGFAWVAIIGLVGVSLSGCAKPTPPPDPVTIKFAHPGYDEGYYEGLVPKFNEQYPHIIVTLESRRSSALGDLSAGDVDVLVTTPEILVGLQAQGQVLSLDPFFDQDESFAVADFYASAKDLLSVQGKTWAIPAGIDMLVMFYSKDLFDQNGVPYPEPGWTWSDFLSAGQAITDPDAGIYGYVISGTTTDPDYFDAALFVYQHGGRLFDSLQAPTRTTFDDPLTVEALEWYAGLYHEYDIAPTPEEARKVFGGSQNAFYEGVRRGNVGMWIGEYSDRGGVGRRGEWSINWGMAPLPRDAQSLTQGTVEGYAIYAQTEHPDACWQWITFLGQQMSPDGEHPHRLIPARRSVAESKVYEQLVGEEVAATAQVSTEGLVLINFAVFAEFGDAMDMFEDGIGEIIDEGADPQQVMTGIQQQLEGAGP